MFSYVYLYIAMFSHTVCFTLHDMQNKSPTANDLWFWVELTKGAVAIWRGESILCAINSLCSAVRIAPRKHTDSLMRFCPAYLDVDHTEVERSSPKRSAARHQCYCSNKRGFPGMGVSKHGWFRRKIPLNWMISGYPRKPPNSNKRIPCLCSILAFLWLKNI